MGAVTIWHPVYRLDGVIKELLERGFTEADIDKIKPVILLEGSNTQKLQSLRQALASSKAACGRSRAASMQRV